MSLSGFSLEFRCYTRKPKWRPGSRCTRSYRLAHLWRDRFVGLGQMLPLFDGRLAPYINLDNAASTPPLRDVADAIERFLPYYSSVHRGSGFKSRVSTVAYDDAHDTVARFVGADTRTNTVIFGKNTTEAINKLAFRFPLPPGSVVLSSEMEHHSNDLPWRRATVVRARVTPDGRLDEDDVDRLLAGYGERIALVTVSGASNVTGFIQPIHRLARKAHRVGASILVDAAQLAPHRRIDVKPDDDPEHIDFVALSAHKMYAPFGTGALVGRRDIFLSGAPEYQGGGTVEIVTADEVHWAGLPDREEAGSPNVIGAIAMAAAARTLMDMGWDELERHEAMLTQYTLERLQSVRGVKVYGESELCTRRRQGRRHTFQRRVHTSHIGGCHSRKRSRDWRAQRLFLRAAVCCAAAAAHARRAVSEASRTSCR